MALMIKTVTAKLAGMRNAQNFVIYPASPERPGVLTVQSERAIGRFLVETGEGLLNWKGSNGKYFAHLNPALGAEPFTFPADFVAACIDAQPKRGDRVGGVVIIG